tara:strand:- start:3649 stop:3834 length:186 start_codon:yes stop_codon:yes gene_type:complete
MNFAYSLYDLAKIGEATLSEAPSQFLNLRIGNQIFLTCTFVKKQISGVAAETEQILNASRQ